MCHSWNQYLVQMIDCLQKDARVGICAGSIYVTEMKTGCRFHTETVEIDRFKVVVPYSGNSLKWEVIFDRKNPSFPPDFIFEDESFNPDLNEMKSLLTWKMDDNYSLFRIIDELVLFYRKDQERRLDTDAKMNFEYRAILRQTEISDRDIEVLFDKKDRRVNFLIKLPVDLAQLHMFDNQDYADKECVALLVKFQTTLDTQLAPVSTQLYLSPNMETLVGEDLGIPRYRNGDCLIGYIAIISNTLNEKIKSIVSKFELRKAYVDGFLDVFGSSVLEYDSWNYSSLSLLFVDKEFTSLLHVNMPGTFPKDKPIFEFQFGGMDNVQTKVEKNYPYSPRWNGKEMAERARSFLRDFIQQLNRKS